MYRGIRMVNRELISSDGFFSSGAMPDRGPERAYGSDILVGSNVS